MILRDVAVGTTVRFVVQGTEFVGVVAGPGDAVIADTNGNPTGSVLVRMDGQQSEFPGTTECEMVEEG